jgi:hypothetical protein
VGPQQSEVLAEIHQVGSGRIIGIASAKHRPRSSDCSVLQTTLNRVARPHVSMSSETPRFSVIIASRCGAADEP